MFEPKLLTKVYLPKVVETNLGELESVIAEKVALADSLVVTDDESGIKSADADAAELTKMADRIKRFRIDFVGWWEKPLDGVVEMCKGYEKRLAEAATSLREKTAEVKDKWAQDKRDELTAQFRDKLSDEFAEDEEVLHSPWWGAWLDGRMDARTKGNWLNKTTRKSTIDAEIEAEFSRVRNGIESMAIAMDGESIEVKTVARRSFLDAFSTEDALRAVYNYKKQQEAIEEARAATGAQKPTPTRHTQPTAIQRTITTDPIDLLTFRLSVTGTRDALFGLKKFCADNGIKVVNLDR